MPEFFPFFIILLAAVLFSSLFERVRVPWVAALIVGGIIVGPYGFGLFEPDSTITFLAHVGLVFLMFMAGLETRFFESQGVKYKIAVVAAFSALIPAAVGAGVGLLFGYSPAAVILLGVIFMASSVALLVPSFQKMGLFDSVLGKTIIGSTVIVDSAALILLSVLLQIQGTTSFLHIFLFYPFLLVTLLALAWLIPRIRWALFSNYAEEQDLFERELRFVLLILVGLVVFFEFVGLHAIIAGFFAGLVLSRSIQSRILKAKLHAISYGFFIPVFFVTLGANTNIGVFWEVSGALVLTLAVLVSSMGAKFGSGFAAGKLVGFTNRESALLGAATAPSLSTTLAVAFLGFGQGIIDGGLLAAIVALSVTTSIVAPLTVGVLGRTLTSQRV
ncbi:hypothetical protein COU20_00290, partial [Candidatus Kaiserbacteria bacterium CG10_big_fil_rev_8_21_14_0_10_59_10]